MIEFLPGRCADRDIAHQAPGLVRKTLSDVATLTVRMCSELIGTFGRWVGDVRQLDDGLCAESAGLTTQPLVAEPVGFKAVGGEGVAIGTHGTPLVIIATQGPLRLVTIGFMST